MHGVRFMRMALKPGSDLGEETEKPQRPTKDPATPITIYGKDFHDTYRLERHLEKNEKRRKRRKQPE